MAKVLVINDDDNFGENRNLNDEGSSSSETTGQNGFTKTLEMVRRAYGPNETRRIWKNLFGLAIPFVLLFSAFNSVASIQSSIHAKHGLGPYSLATIYLSGCISSLFFISLILSKVTCKLAILLSIFGSLFFLVAQFFPMFVTLLPAAALMGIGGCVIWTSQANYVSRISNEYAYLTGEEVGIVFSKFFGIFFFLFQTAGIWGNLILATTLSTGSSTTDDNSTENSTAICGAAFCPASFNSQKPNSSDSGQNPLPQSTLNLLFGIATAFVLVGAVILYFCVDPLSRYGEGCRDLQKRTSAKDLLLATLKQMGDPYQLLLIPFIFFSTFQTGFLLIDFTAGYISCAWGVANIGKIMISFSIAAATSSFVFSKLILVIGRIGIFTIIMVAHLSADSLMLYWIPTKEQPYGFFLIAIISGIFEGVCSGQLVAFTALVFPENKEAAFNNQRLWQSLGFIVAYVNGTLFCMTVKLYLMMGVAVVAFICYLVVEVSYTRKTKNLSKI